VFNENQPGHHTILRSQKVDNLLEIGTILENPGNLDSIIKKNTTLMTTAVPIASKNNINDMLKYRNKSRL